MEAGRSFTSFANKSSITKCPLTLVPVDFCSAVILLGQEVPRHFNTSLRVWTRKHACSCSAELEVAWDVPVIVMAKPLRPVMVVTPMLSGPIPGNLQEMLMGSFCTQKGEGAIPVSAMMRCSHVML
eukprot:1405747-Ditylum_brightwellii.AAC.1